MDVKPPHALSSEAQAILNLPILIVDDSPFGSMIVEHILQCEGFTNLLSFDDPENALAFALQRKPALIITDFQMPRMDGAELLNRLDEAYPGIDGIIVTGAPAIASQCSGRFPVLEKGDGIGEKLLRLVLICVDKLGVLSEEIRKGNLHAIPHDTDRAELLSLINESSNLENAVARLYLLLSGIFREEQSFWLDLYIEEKLHATIFNIFAQDEMPIALFPRQMVDTDIESLRQNIGKIDAAITIYKQNHPSLAAACEFALEIEQMVTERLFQETITCEKPDSVIFLLQRINKDSHDHYRRISEFYKARCKTTKC